ncbi:MAG: hypothetical protein LBD77_07130 [Bifidobacteriaceae bacterium]|jgi:predicted transcriptional regulator|nr:hypothetical protein [Bifidobacteriaceae bacterium]
MSVLTIRLDDRLGEALAYLQANAGGASKSQVTRDALLAAEQAAKRAALRAESRALTADTADQAAIRELTAEMAGVNAW